MAGNAIAAYNSQVYLTAQPSIALTNELCTDVGALHTTYTITNTAKKRLDPKVPIVVSTSPDGSTWTVATTGFTLSRVNARVIFAVANAANIQVRFTSASYFVEALLAEAANFDNGLKMAKIDTTVFNSAGVESSIPGIFSGTIKTKTFWINQTRSLSMIARDLLVLSVVLPSGNRYEGYVWSDAMSVKGDPKTAIDQDLSFVLTDEFFTS